MRWQTLAKTIGQNMKRFRKLKGWTQEQAAERAKISTRYWQQLESAEKNMTIRTLLVLTRALEISLTDLIS